MEKKFHKRKGAQLVGTLARVDQRMLEGETLGRLSLVSLVPEPSDKPKLHSPFGAGAGAGAVP